MKKTFQEEAHVYLTKLRDLSKKQNKPIFIWMYIQEEKEHLKWKDYCSYVTSDMSYFDNLWAIWQITKMIVDDNTNTTDIEEKQPWEK